MARSFTTGRISFTLLVLIISTISVQNGKALNKMEVAFKWDQITYVFDSDQQREHLERRGIFIQGDSAPFDLDVDVKRQRVFISMPHVLSGSAVTLATIENNSQHYNPRLRPYPDWSWHANNSGCDGLTSVYRMEVDKCGRLWALDSGIDLSLGNFRMACPPQLLVFNLSTDTLISRRRFEVGECEVSAMGAIVTEHMDDRCSDDVYAYISDAGSLKVIVYHLRTQRSWRVSNNLFSADITARNFIVNGHQLKMYIGVLGLALSPCLDDQCDRYLFINSATSYTEGRMRTSVLRNASLFINGSSVSEDALDIIGNRQRQIFTKAISKEGYMFFGQIGDNTVNCWNTNKTFNSDNIKVVDYDSDRISIILGIKVITNLQGEQYVGLISTNMTAYFSKMYFANSTYPIYILQDTVSSLVANSGC